MNLIRVNATKSVVILIYTTGALMTFLFNDLVNFGYGFSLGFGPVNINKITIIIITESILLKSLSFISTAIYAPIKEPIKANKPM